MVYRLHEKEKMKRLYNEETDNYTHEANELSHQAAEILKPLLKKWSEEGYSIRDISNIIRAEVSMLECETVLWENNKKVKKDANVHTLSKHNRVRKGS